MESVILQSPLMLCCYAAALALCAVGIVKKTGFAVTAVSVVIFVATSIYALLSDAPLEEVGIVAIIFMCVNIAALPRGRGDK